MDKEKLLNIISKAEEEKRHLTDEEKKMLQEAIETRADEEEKPKEEAPADEEVKSDEDVAESGETEEARSEEDETSDEKKEEAEEKAEDADEDKKKTEEAENRNVNNNSNNSNKMEKKRFSLTKELRKAAETGKKFEMSAEELRAYTVSAEGEDVVQTDIYDIWEPLRAKNVLVQAGARTITGIKNNVQIPLMSAVSCQFAGETSAAQDGSGAFTHKTLSPKRITAKYPVSLMLLAQDSIGVENAIRNDISKALNSKLEETLLGSAAGSEYKPAGLFYNTSASTINNFAAITALEAGIEAENFSEGKYIISPSAKADLRNMAKSSKSTQLVMEGGEIDGTQAFVTSHVKGKNIAYGDWSNLVIAAWDNVQFDVVRDVDSLANGVVTIVVNAFVDAALIRENAIAFGTTGA